MTDRRTNTEAGQYVRDHYHVPAHTGGRILFNERPATITGFDPPHYLSVRFDSEEQTRALHPTWHVEYLPGTDEDVELCGWCLHPIDDHGTTEIGCAQCACGHEPDFHPEPDRPEPWGNA